MKCRQVLAATAGAVATAGCLDVLADESPWGDIEALLVTVRNDHDVESTITVSLQGIDGRQSNEQTVQPGGRFSWLHHSPGDSGDGEPGITISSTVQDHSRTQFVDFDGVDCSGLTVSAVTSSEGFEVERECGVDEES